MVGRVRFGMAVICALAAAVPAAAEVQTTVEISAAAGVTRSADAPAFFTTEEGRVVFQAVGARDVKALLEADAAITPGGNPDFSIAVPRAYVKVRMPGFRLTVGKTRLSWGRGFLFDAGDVIFGAVPFSADLSAADPRDRTAWLISPYVALGDFSYLEAVFLPVMPSLPSPVPAAPLPLISVDSISGGARAVIGLPGFQAEAGYLYDGEEDEHKAYISLQGSLFFELYGAAGISIPQNAAAWEDFDQSLTFTCGMYRVFDLEDLGSLTVRAEAALTPVGRWTEAEGGLPPGVQDYGALVFFETAYSPEDTLSFSVRSLFSPVDLSGAVFAGASWGIYQGFTVSCTGFVMFGDPDDMYGWDRDGDIGITAGLKYAF